MPKRKKTFPCGHKGYGRVCHRCEQVKIAEEQEYRELEDRKNKKLEWEASFAQDLIDLRGLPDYVVIKARVIIDGLTSNKNYREFGGKRLRHNRFVISIPVTRNYRMLCQDSGSFLIPQKVLSHEDYNVCKPGKL
ncbi:hypothetical protein H4N54_00560 [Limnospira fusiformis KN01]|uniref:DUF7682 family zinc-binding protein n=1 Tax=Limnospira fusiformis TaxID=54297 RepID=UPI0016587563|nr:hypothetical protein [Limnospira fusiformis]ULB45932.1 hypothetical protein H4N54_00560 [Limnospira fusiformis KN01]